jgi:hypothetical protein
MSSSDKLLFAISQANTEPWISIWKNGQQTTWMSDNHSRVEIINFQSKKTPLLVKKYDYWFEKFRYRKYLGFLIGYLNYLNRFIIRRSIPKYEYLQSNNLLVANTWSTYQVMGRRNFALFHYFYYSTDYDFLFMSNTSSYFNQDLVMKLIDSLNSSEDLYAGIIISPGSPRSFVSGAGKLLSRKTVKKLLDNAANYRHDNLEDVCLGDLMRSLGIKPTPLPRLDVSHPNQVKDIPLDLLNHHFHYRCKSSSRPRQDVEIMLELHAFLKENYRKNTI